MREKRLLEKDRSESELRPDASEGDPPSADECGESGESGAEGRPGNVPPKAAGKLRRACAQSMRPQHCSQDHREGDGARRVRATQQARALSICFKSILATPPVARIV